MVLSRPLLALTLALASTPACEVRSEAAPLPSWNDGETRRAILEFVERVTREGSVDFVPQDKRIAAFDNDGTLWTEKPIYVQAAFVDERVKELAPRHPEWKDTQPFKGVLEGDAKAVAATGDAGVMKLLSAASAGVSTELFERDVATWLSTAKHPRFDRPYTELVYQPMVELLDYLRAKGFKTFIVSGGGNDFIRVWAERAYGIPPEQVIGSRLRLRYEVHDGTPELMRLPELDLVDDGKGKPVGIQELIGRRPIAAFGNSDGDFEMLEWTTSGPGLRFGLVVHHTDAEREWAYDRDSLVGKLSRALDEAPEHGWTVVDMKRDWKVIYPFERR
jgi:phosphoglycolate phosphatase-like HAD superfamily hydrolase